MFVVHKDRPCPPYIYPWACFDRRLLIGPYPCTFEDDSRRGPCKLEMLAITGGVGAGARFLFSLQSHSEACRIHMQEPHLHTRASQMANISPTSSGTSASKKLTAASQLSSSSTLTDDATYLDVIRSLLPSRPNLGLLVEELAKQYTPKREGAHRRGRVTVVDFTPDIPTTTFLDSPESIKGFLTTPNGAETSSKRLFLVEDIGAEYVNVFGSHFLIDPSLFATHMQSKSWITSLSWSATPQLPSALKTKTSFSLRYHEVMLLSSTDTHHRLGEQNLDPIHGNVRRGIKVGRFQKTDGICPAVMLRAASFWSKMKSTGGWDGNGRAT